MATGTVNVNGGVITGVDELSLSIPSRTLTTISTLTLQKGTYIIVGGFQFTASLSGTLCYGTLATNATLIGTLVRFDGNAGGGYNATTIVALGETSNIYLKAYQNSGNTVDASGVFLRAVKIG